MLRFANLQLLFILTTLLLVNCNAYGTKGGSQTKYTPEPEDEFDVGSGWEGVNQEKRPYEKGSDSLGNKAIKFMDKQQDLENNDHLGSHGLGVGIVPHGTKSISGNDNSYVGSETSQSGKDIQYADNNSGSGDKDFNFFKRDETFEGELSNVGKDFIPKEKVSTDKGSSYGGKDFIPNEKDSIDNHFPYEGKDSIPKGKIPIVGGVGIYNVDKISNNGGKGPSFGISNIGNDGQKINGGRVDSTNEDKDNSQGGKDVTYSYGKDKGVDNPFQEKDHVFNNDRKDLFNREYPEKRDDYPKGYPEVKDDPYDEYSEEENPGLFDSFGTILQGLKNKIASIGHKAGNKAKSTLGHLKESHTEVKEKSHDLWDKIVGKFWNFLGKVDRVAERGGQYVLRGFSDVYNEAKGSQLIAKLTQRLVDGDKVVDQFFKKVGEKVSKWLQQHGHDNVDEGLFAPEKEVEEQFSNPQFPNLFQDIEIHQELDKLVQSGIIQQEEVDQLSKLRNIHQDKKKVTGVKY